jgi:cation-transporting ATPase I
MEAVGQRRVESSLRAVQGVQSVRADPLTGSVVVQYAPDLADESKIVNALTTLPTRSESSTDPCEDKPWRREASNVSIVNDGVIRRGEKLLRRVRVAVPGLESDVAVSKQVVERLRRRVGVHAHANPLTGRVLIEFDEDVNKLLDLLGDVVDVELPQEPGEDQPHYPLDPAPLNQGIVRTAGAGVGLGLLAVMRLAAAEGPIVEGPAVAWLSGAISLMQGIPAVKNGVRRILGRNVGDLALAVPDIGLASLLGSPLSLLVNGTGALRLWLTASARMERWKEYESRLGDAPVMEPGCQVNLEAGHITSMPARVIEGSGTATDFNGTAINFGPGIEIPPGAKLRGNGPFVLEILETKPFEMALRPEHPPDFANFYHEWNPPVSVALATVLGLATRSAGRAMEAMLCLSPRAAMSGIEAAHLNASARVIRGGATVVGTRTNRPIRKPDALIVDSARILTDGLEISSIELIEPGIDAGDALKIAAQISNAARSPWGELFGPAPTLAQGEFRDGEARATIDGTDYLLTLLQNETSIAEILLSRRVGSRTRRIAVYSVRARLATGLLELRETCRRNGVDLVILSRGGSATTKEIAGRAHLTLSDEHPRNIISRIQSQGQRVAYVSDGAHGAAPFNQCDLAIGYTSGNHGRFAARADLLAPDLSVIASIIDAGAICNKVIRDSVGLGILSNVVGAVMCVLGPTGIVAASRTVHAATLTAYANAAFRFRGGEKQTALTDRFTDPRPEQRWGKRTVEEVLSELQTSESGLTLDQVSKRLDLQSHSEGLPAVRKSAFWRAIGAQLGSPLIGLMAFGAALTFVIGTPVEFGFVTVTVLANIVFGAWQERQVQGASQALVKMTPTKATVVRGGERLEVSANELVPGDIVLLSAGHRVPADVRLVRSESLEVDESSLTGESHPVPKSRDSAWEMNRILLEGSDVTVGHAVAVVVAVGSKTRFGSIALAVSHEEQSRSPLNNRLAALLQQFLPLAGAAGAIVFLSGVLRGRELMRELVFASTLALSAIPEGLPLLAGVAEVAVSRRLAGRNAKLRRLGAVEALGRVDVACTDKTGTLTQGKLALSIVATTERVALLELSEAEEMSAQLRQVVIAAALASPHPEASNVSAHPTDLAVLNGAANLGMLLDISIVRQEEAPFEPTRAYHASRVAGRIVVKGAPEAVVERCSHVRTENGDIPLDPGGRSNLLTETEQLASRGLRILMVAEGHPGVAVEDPLGLTVLGFIGIRDPLRQGVREAVDRCHKAGVRVIVLTGDHPATARAIAADAGLADASAEVLTGIEISGLNNEELDERMKLVSVVARVTPLDKVRIVQSLQRMGHTVAMTGDGVNDAPALRLADVGVAMGLTGTDVARQAADVVLSDDDFATLVEALVEGRGFWQNIRRTLGLLLGGILGELGFVAIASAIGMPAALNTRQILAMNLITFGLPTLAVALQEPEHRNLAGLAREGTTALVKPLRKDVLLRAGATIIPSLTAFALALPGGTAQAQTVAFGTAIGSQLAQTMDSGRSETGLTKSVVGAVGTSLALLVASVMVPGGRTLLSLAIPSVGSLLLILVGSTSSPLVARALNLSNWQPQLPKALPAPSFA